MISIASFKIPFNCGRSGDGHHCAKHFVAEVDLQGLHDLPVIDFDENSSRLRKRGSDPLQYHIRYSTVHGVSYQGVLLLSLQHTIDVDKQIGLEFCRPGGGANTRLFWSPKTNTAKLHLMVRARRVVTVSPDEWCFGDDAGSGIRGKSHLNSTFRFTAELKMLTDIGLHSVHTPITFDARFWSKGNCPSKVFARRMNMKRQQPHQIASASVGHGPPGAPDPKRHSPGGPMNEDIKPANNAMFPSDLLQAGRSHTQNPLSPSLLSPSALKAGLTEQQSIIEGLQLLLVQASQRQQDAQANQTLSLHWKMVCAHLEQAHVHVANAVAVQHAELAVSLTDHNGQKHMAAPQQNGMLPQKHGMPHQNVAHMALAGGVNGSMVSAYADGKPMLTEAQAHVLASQAHAQFKPRGFGAAHGHSHESLNSDNMEAQTTAVTEVGSNSQGPLAIAKAMGGVGVPGAGASAQDYRMMLSNMTAAAAAASHGVPAAHVVTPAAHALAMHQSQSAAQNSHAAPPNALGLGQLTKAATTVGGDLASLLLQAHSLQQMKNSPISSLPATKAVSVAADAALAGGSASAVSAAASPASTLPAPPTGDIKMEAVPNTGSEASA